MLPLLFRMFTFSKQFAQVPQQVRRIPWLNLVIADCIENQLFDHVIALFEVFVAQPFIGEKHTNAHQTYYKNSRILKKTHALL